MNHLSFDLSGRWELRRSDLAESIPAQLPGDNASALLDAGIIPDPYFRCNESAVADLMNHDWIYRRSFSLDTGFLAHDRIFLELEQVDTFADFRINDRLAGSTANQFLRCRFEVKSLLRVGENTITVYFHSPAARAAERARLLPYEVPYPAHVRLPHLNLIRKSQCCAGWDWGIALPTSGIYETIRLRTADGPRLDTILVRQEHSSGHCKVTVEAGLQADAAGEAEVRFEFADRQMSVGLNVLPGFNRAECVFELENPRLWWPNGYGDQPLYDLTVSCGGQTERRKIGLRELRVRNDRDEIGRSFEIEVNQVKIFAKGADWIPADAFPQRRAAKLAGLLDSARRANMNILRVWGGGQYESECFYEFCDQYGLLVWQDFMFACALYPANDPFLAEVRAEADYQVSRLQHHACVALWCGDNEVLGALSWYEPSRKNRDLYVGNYLLVNRELERAVADWDPGRLFWPSSPCGGAGNFGNNWLADSFGDMHFWEVGFGGKNFDAYYTVRPRFCSEFGFQSFPSEETVKSYTLPEDRNVFSPVMDHHQKCPLGNKAIIGMFDEYFRLPTDFEGFLYLSQVQQAVAITKGVEYWRTLRPRCMGVIFWQLNDNWPVASWSSIEYNGAWKHLHYHAKRFYAPVIAVMTHLPGESIKLILVCDPPDGIHFELGLSMRDFSGRILRSLRYSGTLSEAGTLELASFDPAELPLALNGMFFALDLTTENRRKEVSRSVAGNVLAPYKQCDLASAKITCEVGPENGNAFRLKLSSDAPAFFVWLSVEGEPGSFDDNSFTLLPEMPREIVYTPQRPLTQEEVEAKLRITHLRESW